MPSVITPCTDLRITVAATCVLTTFLLLDSRRFDEVAAAPCRAIESVLGRVLNKLAVPVLLEMHIEQLLDVLWRYVIRGAAFWGHVRGVFDGQGEGSLDAAVAHVVVAFQVSSFSNRDIAHADDTFDSSSRVS